MPYCVKSGTLIQQWGCQRHKKFASGKKAGIVEDLLTFDIRNLSGRGRMGKKGMAYKREGSIWSSRYFSLYKLSQRGAESTRIQHLPEKTC